ncbi:MAG: arylsulfotransferase family protein [Planctomycetota bacterium]
MNRVQKAAALYLGALVCICYGYKVGNDQWWPYGIVEEINGFIEGHPEAAPTTTLEKIINDVGGKPARKLVDYTAESAFPDRSYRGVDIPSMNSRRLAPLVFLDGEKAASGLRVIYGSFDFEDGLNGAVLLDEDGEIIHTWIVNELNLPWVNREDDEKFPHGFLVEPDGSIVFAFDKGVSIQRFDWWSRRIWAAEIPIDHAINRGAPGVIWALQERLVWEMDLQTGELRNCFNLSSLIDENPEIDPLGLRQYELRTSWTWGSGSGYWHVNDAEPLPAELAEAFPQFDVGDLLMSFRNINLIFVCSPVTGEIKWWRVGNWRRQHDPDWQPNGMISVFNNNMHRDVSSILEIDPNTYVCRPLFNGAEEGFYTWIRGKHSVLDNGNITMTSPQQGRAFEVNQKGEVVFEFVNRYDQEHTMLVSEIIQLPLDYFDFDLETGPASKPPRDPIIHRYDVEELETWAGLRDNVTAD